MSAIEKLGGSIQEVASATSESPWKVIDRLRRGQYRARKAGRWTIVEWASVREVFESLPVARFTPPDQKRHERLLSEIAAAPSREAAAKILRQYPTELLRDAEREALLAAAQDIIQEKPD